MIMSGFLHRVSYNSYCRSPPSLTIPFFRRGSPRSLIFLKHHRRSIFPWQQKACGLLLWCPRPLTVYSLSHQEDYHTFASLSLDVDGLRRSIRKSLGFEWVPENPNDRVARQAVFIGLYDGLVPLSPI